MEQSNFLVSFVQLLEREKKKSGVGVGVGGGGGEVTISHN